MMKRSVGLTVLLIPLLMLGCVSSGKYKKLESDRNVWKAKSAELDVHVNDLKTQNAVLTQEKATLEAQSQQTKTDYEQMVGQLAQEVQQGQLTITQYKNMLSVDVAEKIFFDSGKAKLKTTGQSVLKKVGDVLAQYPDKLIRVVGHTDNVPVAKSYQGVFPSNWELSALRATNVVRFLQDTANIPGDRLMAVGRGEFDPISGNDTPEGRQQNRRIEIMLIDKTLQEKMETK